MKTIIVPVDYSMAAENVALYAAGLAAATHSSLILLNTYQIPLNTHDMPALLVPVDDMEKDVLLQLNHFKDSLLLQYPSLTITTVARLGDVADELEDLCREQPPFAIVAGHHHGGALDRLIEGNTALSLVRHTKQPLWIVPDTVGSYQAQNIVLAADKDFTPAQLEKATGLATALNGHLQPLFVQTGEDSEAVSASYQTVKAESFIEGIQSYIAAHPVDLILIFPQHHNLIERLFYTSHTEELVNKLEVPVLCLREGNDDR